MVFFALSCATGVVGAFMKVKHMAGASTVLVISMVATLFFLLSFVQYYEQMMYIWSQ